MKSKGILIASVVAAALVAGGCTQKPPKPGHATMKHCPKTMKSSKRHSNKCSTNKCKANKCKAND